MEYPLSLALADFLPVIAMAVGGRAARPLRPPPGRGRRRLAHRAGRRAQGRLETDHGDPRAGPRVAGRGPVLPARHRVHADGLGAAGDRIRLGGRRRGRSPASPCWASPPRSRSWTPGRC
ncbi:hypothetical protein ACFSTC_26625 [Nonomuraea ferruginea]